MFIVKGYTACCGKPTQKDGDYDVFIYAAETGAAFVYIACGKSEQCEGEIPGNGKSERGIVPVPRTTGPVPQSISAAFLRAPNRNRMSLDGNSRRV